MPLRRYILAASVLVGAGLILGCSGGEQGGKPMKDMVVKPGADSGAERETKTSKGGKKPQPGVPALPVPPEDK